jgi:hypothetical protein
MTEDQAVEVISLLTEIKFCLETKLDHLSSKLDDAIKELGEIERAVGNLDTYLSP